MLQTMTEKLTLWMTVGAPGSGKSTWAKDFVAKNPSVVRVCPDDCRRAICGDSNNQSVSYPAFCMAKKQMQKAFDDGKSVVFDAANMYRRSRKDFINMARVRGIKTIAQVFECDKATLLARNIKRGAEGGRNVSETVIDTMLARYQRPETSEFNEVIFATKKL
jgi:predicted kinase